MIDPRASVIPRIALALACAVTLAVLALAPSSAQARETWVHGTVVGCQCHFTGMVDAACTTSCHLGLASVPGQKCWSCHAPGSDTVLLSSDSEACAQECHLYERTLYSYGYLTPYQHGAEPHFGAEPVYGGCLDCHAAGGPNGTSIESAHHSGLTLEAPSCIRCHDGVVASKQGDHGPHGCLECHVDMDRPEMPANCTACHLETTATGQECQECHLEHIHAPVGTCRSCHGAYFRHAAAAVDCRKCHRGSPLLHHGFEVVGATTCRTCHARGHAGTRVPGSKCSACHTGKTPLANPSAQHSRKVTRLINCRTCHTKKVVHAKATRPAYTCRTCHKSRYHSLQKKPTNATCLACHPRAAYHTGPFKCVLCHRRAVHDRTP
jgi:hypothetical protein